MKLLSKFFCLILAKQICIFVDVPSTWSYIFTYVSDCFFKFLDFLYFISLWPSKVFMYIASWSYKIICRSKLNDKFHLRFKSAISLRSYGISDLYWFCYLGRYLVLPLLSFQGCREIWGMSCSRMCCRAGFTQVWRLEIKTSTFLLLKNLSFLHKLIFLKFLSLKINV